MDNFPSDLKYTKTHEWASLSEDTITVGITFHAQELLGEMVYVELPDLNVDVTAGDEIAVVESVKAASDVYSPVSGQIVEVNTQIADNPAIVNDDPYGAGWLFKVKVSNTEQLGALLDADNYSQSVEAEGH